MAFVGTFIKGTIIKKGTAISLGHLKVEVPRGTTIAEGDDSIIIFSKITGENAEAIADTDLQDFLHENYQDFLTLRQSYDCVLELCIEMNEAQCEFFQMPPDVLVILSILNFTVTVSVVPKGTSDPDPT